MSQTLIKSVPVYTPSMNVVQRVQQYFAMRRALNEVRTLDERMLRDIGLDQSQVEAAVRGRL